ncbi:MAG TPA: hypothetical protein VJP02_18955 [Candidatus Sulfotelmatobacter sp.]|nr:hypothetical protein [Candidatus Sulfotelmatobacter sp.]
MKSKTSAGLIALTLLAALATPVSLAAQRQTAKKHHRYKLIDTGTLGGPTSSLGFEGERDINNRGVLVSLADTPPTDPYAPNCFLDCFLAHTVEWRDGVLTDLGALPVTNNSGPVWISDNGLISGLSQNGVIDPLTGAPEFGAVLWKDGGLLDLGAFGGNNSCAGAVNDMGEMVGAAATAVSDPFSFCFGVQQSHAFLWQDGSMQDLGTLGGPDSIAQFINDSGQVAGISYVNSIVNPNTGVPTLHPFMWQHGHMKDLGTIGGTFVSQVNHLNDGGQLVGAMSTKGDQALHPFLWDGRKMRDLHTLGGDFGDAFWVNDSGDVVGVATISGDQIRHGFLWSQGFLTDLGVAPGDQCSVAYAISTRGEIVGSSDDCFGNSANALLWRRGHLTNLNNFVRSGSGVQLTVALNINERGDIAVQGVVANGDTHAFLLIPCEGEHIADEGCEDEGDITAVAVQSNPAPNDQNPPRAMDTGLSPKEIATRMRARFGQNRAIGAWQRR